MGGLRIFTLMFLLLAVGVLAAPRASAQLISGRVTLSTGGPPSSNDDTPGSGGAFTNFGPFTNGADGYEIAAQNYGSTPDNIPPNVTFVWMFSANSQMGSYPIMNFTASGFGDFATESGGSTVISIADGCSSISQIVDANSYALTSSSLQVQAGDFLVLKNVTAGYSGYYGVVQMISGATTVDGTASATFNWWLLTDGSDNFSIAAVPEPGSCHLLIVALAASTIFVYRRHRRTRHPSNRPVIP